MVAVAALLISTTAWLSLVLSGTTTRCWRRFKDWEGSPHSLSRSLPWSSSPNRRSIPTLPRLELPAAYPRNRSLSECGNEKKELLLNDIVLE